jgi:hypothetical protein
MALNTCEWRLASYSAGTPVGAGTRIFAGAGLDEGFGL